MATEISSTSSASRVLDHITEERFTGLLRVSAHEATGEFWFLAGILDEGRFGVSKGEEARERLLRATQVRFQAELRLPHVTAGFKKPMPASGSFAEFRPVVLMRHCESYALTCSLELRGDRTVRLTYRAGELLSVDAATGNDALPALLESDQGSFEFTLPTFELPEGSVAPLAPSASKVPLAERIDRLLADEAAAGQAPLPSDEAAAASAEAKRKADEAAAAAEAKRKADEAAAAAAEAKRKAEEAAAAAEAKRQAEEAAAAEAKRKADEAAAAAEAKRKADEAAAAAEAKRKADQAAAAEAKRKADQAAAAEAKRKADQVAAAEAKRKADEAAAAAEAKRQAEEAAAAEAKRQAEEAAAAEAKRQAEEAAAAEAKRQAEEAAAAEAKRQAEEAAAAEAKRKDEEVAVAAPKGAREAKPKKGAQRAKGAGSSKPKSRPAESSEQDDEQLRVPTRKGASRWPLVLLALLLLGVAYFMMVRMGLV